MFSIQTKRELAEAVQKLLRETNHPELPEGEISFILHVDGAKSSSWANIHNNKAAVSLQFSNEGKTLYNITSR